MTKKITMTADQLNELLNQAKQEALAQAKNRPLTMKVSGKGALSVYGLGRFPVTLYGEQWTRLLSHASQLSAFIEANKGSLTSKHAAE